MLLDEIVFGVPLVFGALLVLANALGLAGLGGDTDVAPAPDVGDLDEAGGVAALGVGPVPLAIVLMLGTLSFGASGFVANALLSSFASDALSLVLSVLLSLVSSRTATRAAVRLIRRHVPSVESYASTKRDVLGHEATVLVVLSTSDVVLRVRDPGGAELRVRGDTHGRAFRVGEQVVLARYDDERDVYHVEPIEGVCEL